MATDALDEIKLLTAADYIGALNRAAPTEMQWEMWKLAGKLCNELNISPETNLSILVEFFKYPGVTH